MGSTSVVAADPAARHRGVAAALVTPATIVVAVGLLVMLAARFILRSQFFGIRRESDAG